MTGLLVALLGAFVFYSKSKYFPEEYARFGFRIPSWTGYFFLLLAVVIYTGRFGPGLGSLIAFLSISAAYSLLPLALNLPRAYVWMLATVFAVFFWMDLAY